jgi:hypothetical protein
MAYDSITSFENFINENTKTTGRVIPGYFYTYHYDYKSTPELTNKLPKSVFDLYDGRPVVFIFDEYRTKSRDIFYRGLNFHFMSLGGRTFWTRALYKLADYYIKNNQRVAFSPKMIRDISIKAKFAYRQYDINKIKYLRKIPYDQVVEMLKYTPTTYEGVTFEEVSRLYKQYSPTVTRTKGNSL